MEFAEPLRHYPLAVNHIEDFGKVKKVYSDSGVYALKTIPPQKGVDFFRNIQQLFQKGYNRIVPIYPATDGRYAVLHNGELSYLMPWLQDDNPGERENRHKQMFRELARIHMISAKEVPVDKENREEHFNLTIQQWKEHREFLDEFMAACERKWYMSPFELNFALHYSEITQALEYAERKLNDWYSKTKDQEKARAVITHGKLSTSHFLYDERGYGYFINFEDSKTAPPHFDLLPFLVKSARTYPTACDDCVDWLYNYLKYFPLKEQEMLLFQSYMAYPGSMVLSVRNYFERKGSRTELEYSTHFQHQYWQLKNVEYMVTKIEEIERRNKEAQANQTQQQS
ncbi:spore coat protein YsxE [Peribacillus sp. SCS-155]|uniref:spore coat protein YsxE n=1 Tax=Peribacillus sedimenti TaxID=3115297 RepID=UPI003906D4F5